jgi:hypothetical protein
MESIFEELQIYIFLSYAGEFDLDVASLWYCQSEAVGAEAAKELLAELYGIQITDVAGLIQQNIVDFRMIGMEFEICTTSRRSYLT